MTRDKYLQLLTEIQESWNYFINIHKPVHLYPVKRGALQPISCEEDAKPQPWGMHAF